MTDKYADLLRHGASPVPDEDEWNLWPSAYIKGSESGQTTLVRLDAAKDQLAG